MVNPPIRVPAAAVHSDAVAVLTRWTPAEEGQRALRHGFLAFLDARPDACARSCVPGHLTASALVLSRDGRRVLLTLHPKVGRWVQLGGHCEDEDTGLVAAALREAGEESGIDGLVIEPEPLHLDVHPITCSLGVPTRHLDVRFLVRTVVRKGSREVAQLPASPDAFVWLRLYQVEMAEQIPRGQTRPLWWTLRARPLTYHAVHRMFERVNERAGTSATLHSLRHTAAYRMAEDPALPLTDVQFVLGHAQLTTTQIYLT